MNEELLAFVQPFQRHEHDNGSPEVQISILTFEITQLQGHLEAHPKDVDAKRSLLKKVARRRKFLKYLKENEVERYTLISKKLKLKV
ncbi:MAG: 30S ribosomal protein S15 [bacterium]|nr:30S ribosomal protein S15 [bacterium]